MLPTQYIPFRRANVAATDSGAAGGSVGDYDSYLKAYWDMQEESGTRDDSVGSNDLADNNTVLFSSSGKYGKAADFENSNSEYLSIASNADLSPTDKMAISVWVRAESLDSVSYLPVNVVVYKPDSYVLEHKDTAGFMFWVAQSDTLEKGAMVGSNASLETWYHLVAIADGSYIYLYCNGTKHTGDAYDGTIADLADPFCVGEFLGAGSCWDGLIDELAIWKGITFANDAARDQFAADLYNSGDGVFWNGSAWVEAV